MKAIIFKQHTKEGKVYRTALYLFGVCVYVEEYPEDEHNRPKPCGFTIFPSDAPTQVDDDDYFEDE